MSSYQIELPNKCIRQINAKQARIKEGESILASVFAKEMELEMA